MTRITLHRTLISTTLTLLVLAAPGAAVLADPGPPAPGFARLWLRELWSWIGAPSPALPAAVRRGAGPAAGGAVRRGSRLQALPQADGSFIDPNGSKTPLPPPPPPPQ